MNIHDRFYAERRDYGISTPRIMTGYGFLLSSVLTGFLLLSIFPLLSFLEITEFHIYFIDGAGTNADLIKKSIIEAHVAVLFFASKIIVERCRSSWLERYSATAASLALRGARWLWFIILSASTVILALSVLHNAVDF